MRRISLLSRGFHYLSFRRGPMPAATSTDSPDRKRQKVEMREVVLKYVKTSENAYAPTRGSKHAAGYDLRSAKECTVPARGQFCVPTDLKIALPDGCYGRIAPRSGLAVKNSIDVGAGVIDQDYRGKVGVILFNFSDKDFLVQKGMRIAQLICERIYYPELEEVKTLDETERGEGGFGSTGKH